MANAALSMMHPIAQVAVYVADHTMIDALIPHAETARIAKGILNLVKGTGERARLDLSELPESGKKAVGPHRPVPDHPLL